MIPVNRSQNHYEQIYVSYIQAIFFRRYIIMAKRTKEQYVSQMLKRIDIFSDMQYTSGSINKIRRQMCLRWIK